MKVEAIDGHELIRQYDSSDLIQLEKDWDRATATYEFIIIPGKPPVRRRHKNKWTDVDPAELAKSKLLKCSTHYVLVHEQ